MVLLEDMLEEMEEVLLEDVEVMLLEDVEDDAWVFRRDRRIRRPLDSLVRHDAAQIPYLSPELQLLYKAKNPRPVDELDFERVVPALDAPARCWLSDALGTWDPHHAWLSALRAKD